MASFLILFLSFVFIQIGNSQFTCTPFQGFLEGDYKQGQPKACPSGHCLTYYVYCEDYWTTQCYDPTKPMGIINGYKPAKSFYANPKKYWYLMTCRQDGSCTDIGSDPLSFDYQLWPKVKKPAARVVENTIAVMADEVIEISGPIQKGATLIWIRLELVDRKGAHIKKKFVFAVPKQQYRLAGKKWKSAKGWIKKLARGSDLTITIKSTESTFQVLANGNDLGITIAKSVGYLEAIAFGGKWVPKSVIKDGVASSYKPKFSPFSPTNLNVACKPKTIAPASTIKYKDISKQMTQIGNITIEISRNSMIGHGHETIELRKTLCQNSDIALIEIGSWRQGSEGQFRIYVELWSRRYFDWNDMKMANIDAASCTTYKITVDDWFVYFICDGSTEPLVKLEYGYAKESIAYLVEQTEREAVCNK